LKRSEVVQAGAEKMRDTEIAIDLALCEAGELLSTLTRLRVTSGMSGVWGRNELALLGQGISGMIAARENIIDFHHGLKGIQGQWAPNVTLTGNDLDKPATKPPGGSASVTQIPSMTA
jgi:hypothetical protein